MVLAVVLATARAVAGWPSGAHAAPVATLLGADCDLHKLHERRPPAWAMEPAVAAD